MRNRILEQQLCNAIGRHLVIRLKYGNDLHWRTFEPQAVYSSTADNINVTGIQTQDKNKPLKAAKREVRNFELAKIKAFDLTDKEFDFDPEFDPRADRFNDGLICYMKRDKTE